MSDESIDAKLDQALRDEKARIAELKSDVDWSGVLAFAKAALNVGARLGLAYLGSISHEQITAWGAKLAGKGDSDG